MDRPILNITIVLPGGTQQLGLTLVFDPIAYLPVIQEIAPTSMLYEQFPPHHRHNVYVLLAGGYEPISTSTLVEIMMQHRNSHPGEPFAMTISKRVQPRVTKLEEVRAVFQQVKLLDMKPPVAPQARTVLISSPVPPIDPQNPKELASSPWRTEYTQAQCEHFMKMMRSGSISIPMLRSLVPPGRNVLHSLQIFSHKPVPDVKHTWELRDRWVSNGTGMQKGIDYEESYSPVARPESIRLCTAIAAHHAMKGYLLDVVNAFQSRFEHNPKHRQYISLPFGFLRWFRAEYPHIKLPSTNPSELVIQTLTSFQGTVDASRKFYKIITPVLEESGFAVSSVDKGVFSKDESSGPRTLACLSTDDILLWSSNRQTFLSLCKKLTQYFEVTTTEGPVLRYLNMRIVVSPAGISLDQTDYILRHVQEYFRDTDVEVPDVDGPFPTDTKFEVELFQSPPLMPEQKEEFAKRHNGSLAHHTGVFMHAVVLSHPDIAYAIMHLAGYMAIPTEAAYKALHHLMCWLYHHPHMPFMYPHKEPKTRSFEKR